MTDQELTEEQANHNLESAIRDWLRASNPDTEHVVTAWTIVAEGLPVEGESEILCIGRSDHVKSSHQLGLLQAAAAYVQKTITDSMEGE